MSKFTLARPQSFLFQKNAQGAEPEAGRHVKDIREVRHASKQGAATG
jgi:hypothetical protein